MFLWRFGGVVGLEDWRVGGLEELEEFEDWRIGGPEEFEVGGVGDWRSDMNQCFHLE